MNIPRLHLASGSPRRRDILRGLGLEFSHGGADIDESRRPGETPRELVARLAVAKAAAVMESYPDHAILGSDTEVILGDRVFGKPANEADSVEMLLALSGRTHEVLTAVAVLHAGRTYTATVASRVRFRAIRAEEARRYWQTGEPQDKAGSYAVQGIGGIFVEHVEGSFSAVIGLPVFETADLLRQVGIDILAGGAVHA